MYGGRVVSVLSVLGDAVLGVSIVGLIGLVIFLYVSDGPVFALDMSVTRRDDDLDEERSET